MATGDSTTDLDVEILDSMAELVAAMLMRAEEVAQRHGVPIFFLKVFHRLDCPMAMKELGQRMRCDPSSSPTSPTNWRSGGWRPARVTRPTGGSSGSPSPRPGWN